MRPSYSSDIEPVNRDRRQSLFSLGARNAPPAPVDAPAPYRGTGQALCGHDGAVLSIELKDGSVRGLLDSSAALRALEMTERGRASNCSERSSVAGGALEGGWGMGDATPQAWRFVYNTRKAPVRCAQGSTVPSRPLPPSYRGQVQRGSLRDRVRYCVNGRDRRTRGRRPGDWVLGIGGRLAGPR